MQRPGILSLRCPPGDTERCQVSGSRSQSLRDVAPPLQNGDQGAGEDIAGARHGLSCLLLLPSAPIHNVVRSHNAVS